MLRNDRAARRIHALAYLVIGFLTLSGLAVLGEGSRRLETLLGGHVTVARSHRWVGAGLLGGVFLLTALRRDAVVRFVSRSVQFRRSDLRWFAAYPRFLLSIRPSPGWHEGHFDPGQRVMNLLVILALTVLSVTGLVMSFPDVVVPVAFAWSLRLHRWATWMLLAAVGGHVLVASGVLPCYRGVARAMHGDGRVPRRLAERLWPAWSRKTPASGEGRCPPGRRYQLLVHRHPRGDHRSGSEGARGRGGRRPVG